MLSIEKCKKILVDDNEAYTDDEIKVIREHLYNMATIVKKNGKAQKNSTDDKRKK